MLPAPTLPSIALFTLFFRDSLEYSHWWSDLLSEVTEVGQCMRDRAEKEVKDI
jgi:hypothetical protein